MHAALLEAELLAFLRPDETAADLLARTYVEPFVTGVPLLDQHVSLRPGTALEVAGAAGSGKTEILVQIAANCILPAYLNGVHYGGRTENVLLYDLDCKFDPLRIMQVLQTRIAAALEAFRQCVAEEELGEVLQDSLQRLHLVRCHSSFDLLAALSVARPLVTRLAAGGPGGGGLRVILLDNIPSYFYQDRVGRGPGGGVAPALGMHDITREGAPLTQQRVQAAAAEALRRLMQEHRLALVATKNLLLPGGRDADPWAPREFMTKPWQELVSQRLMLRVLPGRQQPQQQGGGGWGGGHMPPPQQQPQQQEGAEAPPLRLARFLEPPAAAAVRFEITEGPIVLA